MDSRILPLLADQSGVVSRRQALAAGLQPHDLLRLQRQRRLAPMHPGVYVDHTGQPTWLQSAWGAVLLHAPAVLAGASALRAVEGAGSRRPAVPIELAIPHHRRCSPPAGITVVRLVHYEDRVRADGFPPRVRYEEAVLDVAGRAPSDFAAIDELSRGIQSRCTTAPRLRAALDARARTPRGRWLGAVLDDVAMGVCSVLEHGHLTLVERPHGLSGARRQVRTRHGAGVIYRDVEYDGGKHAELDGRLFHNTTSQRDRDFDRDLVTAAAGGDTVRLSYGQVFDRPCWTALHLHRWLVGDPTAALPRTCGPACAGRIPDAA